MDLFVAVVFVCVNSDCTFLQSEKTYPTFNGCIRSAAEEIKSLVQENPQITMIDGACIKVPMKGA